MPGPQRCLRRGSRSSVELYVAYAVGIVPYQRGWDTESVETFDDFDLRLVFCR